MKEQQPACPKCSNKMIWNGRGMACIACNHVTPTESTKSTVEKKLPTPRKSK